MSLLMTPSFPQYGVILLCKENSMELLKAHSLAETKWHMTYLTLVPRSDLPARFSLHLMELTVCTFLEFI